MSNIYRHCEAAKRLAVAIQNVKFIFVFLVLFLCTGAISPTVITNLLRNPGDPVGGNPKGSVTVVEFFDYHCGYCVQLEPTIRSLLSRHPNVRFVYKEYPVLGLDSTNAARIALAANMQGNYLKLHKALLSGQYSLTEESIYALAQTLGLNVAKLKEDAASSRVTQQINANLNTGSALNVLGTPSFFIAKTKATQAGDVMAIMGATSLSELESAIAETAKG